LDYDDDDDNDDIPQGELRARGCINPQVLGARLSPAAVDDHRSENRARLVHA
jgi:hypothetical protein